MLIYHSNENILKDFSGCTTVLEQVCSLKRDFPGTRNSWNDYPEWGIFLPRLPPDKDSCFFVNCQTFLFREFWLSSERVFALR